MMSFFMDSVSFITRERSRWVSDNRRGSRFPKIYHFITSAEHHHPLDTKTGP